MEPTIGRIVHFTESSGRTIAAIVTAVHPDHCVELTVFQPGTAPGWVTLGPKGTPDETPLIPFAEQPTPGHWNWPPRA
ncbi:hypothetical protein GS909_07045 [Rhodococcus hoagii]|uniref:hypothetical protein n=1 Tax=Rhodococcus hoagii TaxID=43767 RepID=UPI000A106720|nr:hypothetical protein [Prescottella equi]NKT17598.1 hypothetical protein [Prescottella equi]NKV10923.1 hypothetical protein [Prescottella equi]ORL38302.1 hypothetical protein A6I87_02640 [Prescottella equi]